MSVDVLAFGAHPDDVELEFGGTLARLCEAGQRVSVVDLTAGERGSRGDAETRRRESQAAAEVLGVASRLTLGLPDQGLIGPDPGQRRQIVETIRAHRPAIVLAPHPNEGHPDHRAASQLVELAVEESRFARSAAAGERHVVSHLLFAWPAAGADQGGGAGGGGELGGGFVIDISDSFTRKREALLAYRSQFDTDGAGVETRLNSNEFLELVEARARVAGASIGVRFGEGFVWRGALRLSSHWAVWLGLGHEPARLGGGASG